MFWSDEGPVLAVAHPLYGPRKCDSSTARAACMETTHAASCIHEANCEHTALRVSPLLDGVK